MGYYVEVPEPKGKFEQIEKMYNGKEMTLEEAKKFLGVIGVIVIVDNGPFEAAAFAYDLDELEAFFRPDDYRPKRIIGIERSLAIILSGADKLYNTNSFNR